MLYGVWRVFVVEVLIFVVPAPPAFLHRGEVISLVFSGDFCISELASRWPLFSPRFRGKFGKTFGVGSGLDSNIVTPSHPPPPPPHPSLSALRVWTKSCVAAIYSACGNRMETPLASISVVC